MHMLGDGSATTCSREGKPVVDGTSNIVLGTRNDLHCSGTVWPAAHALFSYLRSHDMYGKAVLELGSGTGWLGLQLGRVFPESHQVCTDHPDYMHALIESLSENSLPNVEARELDWAAPWPDEEFNKFTMVIGSDLVYNVYLTKDAGVDWPLHEACVSHGIGLHVLEVNGSQRSEDRNVDEIPQGQFPVIFQVRSGEMPKYSTALLRSAITQAEMRSMREWEMADEDERSDILMAAAIAEIEW
ncbi:hypothetical protein GUITHDRAFT_140277 [Guillardia theta CCMP2712]|uniref:Uncharacterized protein n=1 Tax=Guillardia theta (strain CCMP2712) TaxID=905079 RepID=L1J6B5_GUITC|nr:hypothetical protein GUITHDRAFT_140277 [Guillardia theta CCMP2712]EKX43847.1 hypothetical protein GUITHDRAFT_140277 [Guillardia theta CCMP2712]|eukprot:XP_005830827.1 hypothetical protein GUITHDRAFT_140277 [Guillardia theta CCMP2712]